MFLFGYTNILNGLIEVRSRHNDLSCVDFFIENIGKVVYMYIH